MWLAEKLDWNGLMNFDVSTLFSLPSTLMIAVTNMDLGSPVITFCENDLQLEQQITQQLGRKYAYFTMSLIRLIHHMSSTRH
jgi:hypothetical protein